MSNIAIIGNGTIGKHLATVAPHYGHKVAVSMTRASFSKFGGEATLDAMKDYFSDQCLKHRVNCAFIAIPSGMGTEEAAYISELGASGICVVTAGKSALANRFRDVQPYIKNIGFDATVGGGTMIPTFLRHHLHADANHPYCITAVLNGTLNYAQTRVRDGVSIEQIVDEALKLGFAEPATTGNLTALDMYRGEFGDVSRKIAIIFNTILQSQTGVVIDQSMVSSTPFTERCLAKVTADNSIYRYLVRICTKAGDVGPFGDNDIGGSIQADIGGIHACAGFVRLEGSLLDWVPNHVGNACVVVQNGERIEIKGQGAGPVPTVGAMFSNQRTLALRAA